MENLEHNVKITIDNLTKIFFSVFNNENNTKPQFHLLRKICLEQVIIIKNSGTLPEIFNLESFICPREIILNDGTLTAFKEQEIAERTQIFGNIAQRLSVYHKQGNLNGQYFEQKGVKTIQFIKTETGWKISSVAWDDEREGLVLMPNNNNLL